MTIQDWGAVGEMIGGLAIIVSLIYVGLQIKQNTKATQVATSQAFIDMHSVVILPIACDKEFRDIYWRGLNGLSNLQGSETAAFGAWTVQALRAWESFYFQWKAGAFDDHLWSGFRTQLGDLFGYAGMREMWKMRSHQFSEEFHVVVAEAISSEHTRPLYVSDEIQQA
jgi:hypothetical protein